MLAKTVKWGDKNALHLASRAGDTEVLAHLLLVSNKADLNVPASEVTTFVVCSAYVPGP